MLTRLSLDGTNSLEQSLIDRINPTASPNDTMAMSNSMADGRMP